MYTQCSGCATLYRVSARHLRAAGGRVRCCLCHEEFDAFATLTEALPPDFDVEELLSRPRTYRLAGAGRGSAGVAAAGEVSVAETPDETALDVPAEVPAAEPPDVTEAAADEAGDAVDAGEEPEAISWPGSPAERDLFTELDIPTFPPDAELEPLARPRRRRSVLPTLLWGLGILALIALLIIQYGYHLVQRSAQLSPYSTATDYVRDPRYRSWFEALCLIARCELPLLRDVSKVHILRRNVSRHETIPNALSVKVTLVNNANFPQPYPQLRLTLLDAAGRETASRWFEPSDYLEDSELRAQLSKGMPPKLPVGVSLELVDPGEGAAESFEFSFR